MNNLHFHSPFDPSSLKHTSNSNGLSHDAVGAHKKSQHSSVYSYIPGLMNPEFEVVTPYKPEAPFKSEPLSPRRFTSNAPSQFQPVNVPTSTQTPSSVFRPVNIRKFQPIRPYPANKKDNSRLHQRQVSNTLSLPAKENITKSPKNKPGFPYILPPCTLKASTIVSILAFMFNCRNGIDHCL